MPTPTGRRRGRGPPDPAMIGDQLPIANTCTTSFVDGSIRTTAASAPPPGLSRPPSLLRSPATQRSPSANTMAPPPTSHAGIGPTEISACTSWVSGSIRTIRPDPSAPAVATQTLPSPKATDRTPLPTENVSTTCAVDGGDGGGSTVPVERGIGCHARSPATPMPGASAIGCADVPSAFMT